MITKTQRDDIINRDGQLRAWLGKRCSYHPRELPPDINPPTNEERSEAELFDWIHSPPDKYFAYVSSDFESIITWTGRRIGTVHWKGDEIRDKKGDKKRHFRMLGTNGKLYSGTAYVSSGDYCRLRQVKS